MASGPGVRIALRFDDEAHVVAAGFVTVAFDAARSVASRICADLLGRTIEEASGLTVLDVAALAGLPPGEAAVRTVHFAKSSALLPVLGRRPRSGPAITCTCFLVPTRAIVRAIRSQRLRTVEELKERTHAGSGCGTCVPDLERLLRENARG